MNTVQAPHILTLAERLKQRTELVLEWPLIAQSLADRTRSPLGNIRALGLRPRLTTTQRLDARKRAQEATQILDLASPLPQYLSGIEDPTLFFVRAKKGGVLEPKEVYACGHFMGSCALITQELKNIEERLPLLRAELEHLPQKPKLCDQISRSVNSAGEILDSASAELLRLRNERSAKRQGFERSLQSKVNDWFRKGYLQDNFFDVLDGRFVVPVRADRQSELKGNLHARSQTRQSLYIEPLEFMQVNNELQELEIHIREEEWRVLRALSASIAAVCDDYQNLVEPLAVLDLAFASAKLSTDWRLNAPSDGGALNVRGLFHPLLNLHGKSAVKNNLTLHAPATGGTSALVISGPNTGGKTVLIKAAALCALMSAAGLGVAAEAECTVPDYVGVLALIGDEQSLGQGLSSFSAQIKDLNEALTIFNGHYLVIVDEILSSTDPEEAAALGLAILEELCDQGHHVLVTTHFSTLALRARATAGMSAAAMEFKNDRPTYRLCLDELGSSHALDVAASLGFPERLLTRARTLVSTDKINYERALKALEEKEATLARSFKEQEENLENELNAARKTLTEERIQNAQLLDSYLDQADERLKQLHAQIEDRLTAYSKQGLNSPEKAAKRIETTTQNVLKDMHQQMAHAKDALLAKAKKDTTGVGKGRQSKRQNNPVIVAGASVKVQSLNNARGKVIELSRDGATALVQVGPLRMERPLADLTASGVVQRQGAASFGGSHGGVAGRGTEVDYIEINQELSSITLDIRGHRRDDAMAKAERFIDQAFRQRAPFVRIITGHGTGVIKAALKELTASIPYVKQIRPEQSHDDGAFLVEFDI